MTKYLAEIILVVNAKTQMKLEKSPISQIFLFLTAKSKTR